MFYVDEDGQEQPCDNESHISPTESCAVRQLRKDVHCRNEQEGTSLDAETQGRKGKGGGEGQVALPADMRAFVLPNLPHRKRA